MIFSIILIMLPVINTVQVTLTWTTDKKLYQHTIRTLIKWESIPIIYQNNTINFSTPFRRIVANRIWKNLFIQILTTKFDFQQVSFCFFYRLEKVHDHGCLPPLPQFILPNFSRTLSNNHKKILLKFSVYKIKSFKLTPSVHPFFCKNK